MAKIYGQLEKAQLENTTSDTASHPKGMITYRTDLNQAKVSNGTTYKLLIDEDSTQTLSNKTYANPLITGAITSAQTTTPANPASGENKLYFKADGKLYTLDSSGNEAIVGSGTGGVKNLITNGNADDTSSSIFVPYADAASTRPVDGTGGSPTVTTSMTTSTPLDGAKSFLLTKPASNVQGQGWSVPFTVDPAYRAKSLKISVDYIVNSGTFVAGGTGVESDVILYIYDVTNSQLIEPSNIKILSNSTTLSDKFEATFQSSATGSSYRLIAHVQSVSALAYELKVDNITVSPQTYVFGTPVTDWVPYTATVAGFGTISSSNFEWRRVGDSVQVKGRFTSGTSTATAATISLPNGIIVDSTKVPNQEELGEWHTNSTATSGFLFVSPGGNTMNMSIGTGLNNNLGNAIAASGGVVVFSSFSIPISGWSSSVQMSDSADTRVVSAILRKTSNQNTVGPAPVKITYQSADNQTHGQADTTNSRINVPVSGVYNVKGTVTINCGTGNGSGYLTVYKNGVGTNYQTTIGCINSTRVQLNINVDIPLKSGDYIELFFGTDANTFNIEASNFSLTRVSGPSAIAASESITAKATTSSTAITTGATTVVVFSSVAFDTHNQYSTSTGKYTVPVSGKYQISGAIYSSSTGGLAVSQEMRLIANQSGSVSTTSIVDRLSAQGTSGFGMGISGSTLFNCLAGDQIWFTFFNGTGNTITLNNAAADNFICIERIGN